MLNAFFQLVQPAGLDERFLKPDTSAASTAAQKRIGQTTRNQAAAAAAAAQSDGLSDISVDDNNNFKEQEDSASSGSSSEEIEEKSPPKQQKGVQSHPNDLRKVFNNVNPETIINILQSRSANLHPAGDNLLSEEEVIQQQQRQKSETALLRNALMHNSFFKRMKRKITTTQYQQLFQEILLESFNPLETVFQHGDQADKFYIILAGEAFILIPLKTSLPTAAVETQIAETTPDVKSPSESSDIQNPLQRVASMFPNFTVVKRLSSGENFGEIGLQMAHSRTATIVCKTHCQIATLSKAAFQRILGGFFNVQVSDKQTFIRQIALFSGYSFAFMTNVMMNARRRVYHYGDCIYEEQSEKMRLYLIKSGDVELSKRVEDSRVVSPSTAAAVFPLKASSSTLQRRIVLACKTAGEWFGEVEMMQRIPRFTRATCMSHRVEAYCISSRKIFMQLDQENFLSILRRNSLLIQTWRDRHFNDLVTGIYNQRDPLHHTFRNLKKGKELVNEKFKQEFLKSSDVASICLQEKPEEAAETAKKVCFGKMRNYVTKITDVLATIKELKGEQAPNQPMQLRSRPRLNLQHISSSLHLSEAADTPQQSSMTHRGMKAGSISSRMQVQQSNPSLTPSRSSVLLLPKIGGDQSYSHFRTMPNEKTIQSSIDIGIRLFKGGQFNEHLPPPPPSVKTQTSKNLTVSSRGSLGYLPYEVVNGNHVAAAAGMNPFSAGGIQQQQMNSVQSSLVALAQVNKEEEKGGSQMRKQKSSNDLLNKQARSLSRLENISVVTPQETGAALSLRRSISVQQQQVFLEGLYDRVVQSKNSSNLVFNESVNQKMLQKGMQRKTRNLHQAKDRVENFSNLHHNLPPEVHLPLAKEVELTRNRQSKLDLYKNLKLSSVLSYKYPSQLNAAVKTSKADQNTSISPLKNLKLYS